MTYNTTYTLNMDNGDTINLFIPHATIEELSSCERIKGNYNSHNGRTFTVIDEHDCIESQLEKWKIMLGESLHNELAIDRALFFNIGYQWNEFLYYPQEQILWDGERYLCFSTVHNTDTFIYTVEQQIIIEIVPTYPWIFREPPAHTQIISFKEFLQTYKPYVYSTISHQTAERWIGQIDALLAIIAYNESPR